MSGLAEKIRRLYVGAGDQSQRDALVDEVQAEVRALSTAREEARREALEEAIAAVDGWEPKTYREALNSDTAKRIISDRLRALSQQQSQQKTGGENG